MAVDKSENNENNVIDAEIISDESTTSDNTSSSHQVTPQSPWGLKAAVFLLLLGLLALGGGGYWYLHQKLLVIDDLVTNNQQIQQALAEVEARQQGHQTALNSSLGNVVKQVDEYQQLFTEMQQNAALRQQQIDNLYSELNESEQRRPSDWLLAEADYLTRMAARKLWLEQDFATAIMLLQDADDRLRQLADPTLLNIRALLANDMQTLQQTNPLDRSALALQLSALIDKSTQLPIIVFNPAIDNIATNDVTESVADWQQNLAALWRNLVDDFISVKTISKPIEPILSAQQQGLIQEQLKYQLMLAQMSVMNADTALYKQSLATANRLIEQYYQVDKYSVRGFKDQLLTLQQTDVSQAEILTLSAQQALSNKLAQRTNKVTATGADEL